MIRNAAPSTVDRPTASRPTPPLHSGVDTTHEARNTLVLECYQIVLRVGWIFKTESIIMPAFLDAVAGAGWLRGFLPVINRFGQSVPPVLYSGRLGEMRHKKWSLVTTTIGMGVPFAALAVLWQYDTGAIRAAMPAIFLALYGIFSCCNGLNQLGYSTLQGKLIAPAHRGRAMVMSTTIGAVLAILFAWMLLGGWLARPDGGFTPIFGFTAACFVLAGIVVPFLAEPADQRPTNVGRRPGHLAASWEILREDRNFRRLNLIAVLFGAVLILFPHYQAMGRERLGLQLENLVLWVIVQNAGAGLFSMWAGPLADRRGYRAVLKVLIMAAATTPLLAVALVSIRPEVGRSLFWLVFLPLGLTPIALKSLVNYALEISDRRQHPRYVSTLHLSLAAPFLVSPLVGWLVDVVGFELVLLTGATVIVAAGALCFTLDEPRRHPPVHVPPVPTTPEA